jgi:hypothetical protein
MNKTVMAFLFCFISSIANAQEIVDLTKPMKCSEVQSVMSYFLNTHNETPMWVGKTVHGTHITLLANKETRSWTMIEYDSRLACVLGAGDEKTSSSLDIKL